VKHLNQVIKPGFLALAVLGISLFGTPITMTPALAQGNCANITNAFAYNECLARSGPQKRMRAARGPRGGNPEATVRGRADFDPAADDSGSRRGIRVTRGRNRTRAVIDPWASIKRTFTPAPRRGRRR
jgi:hypothetical protein